MGVQGLKGRTWMSRTRGRGQQSEGGRGGREGVPRRPPVRRRDARWGIPAGSRLGGYRGGQASLREEWGRWSSVAS